MRIRWSEIVPVLIFLVMGIQACSSSRNSSAQEHKTTSAPHALQPAPATLAPGMARIVAMPIAIHKQESKILCILKVDKIIGYGMSTPSVTVKSEIQTDLSALPNQQLEQISSAVQQRAMITITIQSLPGGMLETKASGWKIIDIDKTTAGKISEE